ncbi:unnamed protein product [Prorocentrum cordatum]|uniref:Sialate O-acetylesterase domain-containing protein n=1 Tax=Prorocentrum cordatum TaxID=2364126 RepID=A0ABN9UK78_9DINO|nr:unnamed protein product [Polarella glacialis]
MAAAPVDAAGIGEALEGAVAPNEEAPVEPAAPAAEPAGALALVLLCGQSNIARRVAGRGPLRDARPLEGPPSALPVLAWTGAGRWSEARHPLHWDKPDRVGVGPGLAFAREAAAEPELLGAGGGAPKGVAGVGLVPAAVGGSAIAEWAPHGGPLLAEARARCAAALGAAPRGSFVACVLWHQGETDAGSESLSEGYASG